MKKALILIVILLLLSGCSIMEREPITTIVHTPVPTVPTVIGTPLSEQDFEYESVRVGVSYEKNLVMDAEAFQKAIDQVIQERANMGWRFVGIEPIIQATNVSSNANITIPYQFLLIFERERE